MLTRERRASRWTDSETMIVFSDGLSDDGCREAIKAAWDAKGKGVGVVSVCVGRHCDEQCMRELASSPRYYCSIDEFNRVVEMLRRIRGEIKDVVLKSLAVTERLPQNMRYVTGSAEPDPWQLSPDEQTLQWITRYVPKDGVTFTLRVEPQELGRQVANHEAVAEFTNNLNWSGTAVFPVPQVEIEKRPSATPTCTATQTATADPTVAPPPSPTGSPPSNQVFLPRLARSMAQ